jgi:hypothetical protein
MLLTITGSRTVTERHANNTVIHQRSSTINDGQRHNVQHQLNRTIQRNQPLSNHTVVGNSSVSTNRTNNKMLKYHNLSPHTGRAGQLKNAKPKATNEPGRTWRNMWRTE